jgi:hypothetical protein
MEGRELASAPLPAVAQPVTGGVKGPLTPSRSAPQLGLASGLKTTIPFFFIFDHALAVGALGLDVDPGALDPALDALDRSRPCSSAAPAPSSSRASIYRKLGVSNRTEAARLAYQNGLVESPIDDR